MFFRKKIKEIKKDTEEIIKILNGDLKEKALEGEEIKNLLSNIELKVKNIVEIPGENGSIDLKIIYEAPQVVLRFDDNNEPYENSVFKAINMLNLISMDDMKKIINAIKCKKNQNNS